MAPNVLLFISALIGIVEADNIYRPIAPTTSSSPSYPEPASIDDVSTSTSYGGVTTPPVKPPIWTWKPPTPAPTGTRFIPKVVPTEQVNVLKIETTFRLCNTECDAFSYDPGVIVNSKGRFKSDGERALAFAIAANVRPLYPGTTLQSTSFIGVVWANETKRHMRETKRRDLFECDARVRVLMQLNLATVGIIDDDPTNPSTVGLIQEIEQELDMSVLNGWLLRNLAEVYFDTERVCEDPHNFQVRISTIEVAKSVEVAVEFERCQTLMDRGGFSELDATCRKELLGMMIAFGFSFFLLCVCLFQCLRACNCGEARTRRERVEDTMKFP